MDAATTIPACFKLLMPIAHIKEKTIAEIPAKPTIPNPGMINTSTTMRMSPIINSTGAPQLECPPKIWLKKNKARHRMPTVPPTPHDGVLISNIRPSIPRVRRMLVIIG